MKRNLLFFWLLLLTLNERVCCQTQIYERYASHERLEVAYLENIPLDGTNTINATIIIAEDSSAWEWLVMEFHIEESMFPNRPESFKRMLRDKKDPTSTIRKSITESYMVIVNYSRRLIVICQYDTLEQYYSLNHYSLNHLTHEKD